MVRCTGALAEVLREVCLYARSILWMVERYESGRSWRVACSLCTWDFVLWCSRYRPAVCKGQRLVLYS